MLNGLWKKSNSVLTFAGAVNLYITGIMVAVNPAILLQPFGQASGLKPGPEELGEVNPVHQDVSFMKGLDCCRYRMPLNHVFMQKRNTQHQQPTPRGDGLLL
ncbi:hypothetical protein D3C81_316440 [compost metagenome]